MAFFDLPLEELQTYKPERSEPTDFNQFWAATLDETRSHPLNPIFEPVDVGLVTVDVFDVTFNGYGGQPIKGWLLLPRQRSEPLPCVVEYVGYGGGRGLPFEWLLWSSAGFAHFVMDTRGQASVWRQGDTPDLQPDGSSPHAPGFMTLGVDSPQTYYYRRLFTDAVRAVEAAQAHPAVDPDRIAVSGGSQGGGVTLAAAGLSSQVKAAMPDVPFLCHFRRAVTITDNFPYQEIVTYCRTHRRALDEVFATLDYFDGMHFAARASAPALFSTALMDMTCPPSTVFAAYNHYAGPKQMRVWTFNQHDGGGIHQVEEKLTFLRGIWPR